ncbi:DUF4345 domain-containing protein [Actinoplanes sp. NPDC051494]|uniref:DUF4345 domain-containing protein n=1 Tax=Actinoplanes sp. NPDC051494 TaxID=3363907 RepID=UPI0037B21469
MTSRKALLVTLTALGVVPVLTGAAGVIGGLRLSPDDTTTTPYFDSEYRFISVWWLAAGVLLWWSLRRPQPRAAVTRGILAVMVLGGLARLLGVVLAGPPPVPFLVAMAVELLGVPALLVWHRRVFPVRS